jgi:hypothetical protein
MIRGVSKIDTILLTEISVKFFDPTGEQLELTAKAAFGSTKTNSTHGATTATTSVWTAATIAKLRELRALMELDMGRIHFENGGEVLVGPATTSAAGGGYAGNSSSGLGEHLGVKQV